jgi:SAM-dependent methyltransferase
MTTSYEYAIRGGLKGRERLRILGRVMAPATHALFDRLTLRDGHVCIDVGCGGGDASIEIARRVAPSGRVVGVDLDEVKLQFAREEAAQLGLTNVDFHKLDFRDHSADGVYDIVYARFLLTHLPDPAAAVRSFFQYVRPGGTIAVEDIDFSGHFTYPPSHAADRYFELYRATVGRRGGDPDIGPKLPSLLLDAGFDEVDLAVVQPSGLTGEAKLLNPLTLQGIADAAITEGLTTRDEVDHLVAELFSYAVNPRTVAGLPRVVQAWGRRPTS